MKQNQTLYRPFPGQSIELKPHDYLKINSKCQCQMCQKCIDCLNPQITLDKKLQQLKKMSTDSLFLSSQVQRTKGLIWFLKKIHSNNNNKYFPSFPIIDTITMSNGQCEFYVAYDAHKWKFISNGVSIKSTILDRKESIDLQYQKRKYIRENIGFGFAMLDHQSEKLIRQFQGKTKYMNSLLNRVAIIKLHEGSKPKSKQKSFSMLRSTSLSPTPIGWSIPTKYQDPQDVILTKYQFQNLFNKARTQFCQLDQIQFLQVFPVMYSEQQNSYVKKIKYFRVDEQNKPHFKLAEGYAQTWIDVNQSMSKLQEEFIQSILHQHKKSKQHIEQEFLNYQTYKLLVFFQMITHITINQALVEYITNDQGRTFALKNIHYIKYEQKHKIQQTENKLPQKKQIPIEDHITDLRVEMKKLYNSYQQNFNRLQGEWTNYSQKWEKDKQFSNEVFKSVTNSKDSSVNFHQILKSNNLAYKQKMLKIGNFNK